MEEQTVVQHMSVKEYLQLIVNSLQEIVVPVKYADSISRPLCGAVADLNQIISQLKDPEPEKAEEVTENG